MKIILKKTLWFTVITKLCLVVVTLFAANGCDKSEIPPTACNVDNPLTDLPWLKEKIDEFNLLVQENQNLSIAIYQCKYGNEEIGFLIDEGNTKPFYNCNGDILCIMGGFAGETCSELNILSQELIWEINNENDAVTQNFYVFSANFDNDDFSKDEQCGYILFEDHGSPFDYHNLFVWAENLPEEYQDHLLPVTVTFHYTGEECGSYPIINIKKIQKQ